MLFTFSTELQFSLPRNTATVGTDVTRTVVVFRCDIMFAEWWLRACEVMGLDINEAELAYKYDGQRVGDLPTQIASAEDLRIAIREGQAMAARAQSRTPRIMIYNLVSVSVSFQYYLLTSYYSAETCYTGTNCSSWRTQEACTRCWRGRRDTH